MIGWIKGCILDKQAPLLLLDVNGIGYEIHAPMTTFYALPENGVVELHTHFVVREDAQLLYGFATREERSLFRNLIKVNGIGPKSALAILSSIEPDAFVACVRNDDVNSLVKIPGIGKKTAERLLVEMRDMLKGWAVAEGHKLPASSESKPASTDGLMIHEAESALVALGYKPVEATRMIAAAKSATEEGYASAEELIRAALKRMV